MVCDFLHSLQLHIQPAGRARNRLHELAAYIVSEQDHIAQGNLSLPHGDAFCVDKTVVSEGELVFLRGLSDGFP